MAKFNNRLEEIKYWDEKRKNSKPLKRTPLNKKVYKLKRQEKPIAKKSKKQSSKEAAYNKLVAHLKTLPENQVCVAKFEGCTHVVEDNHHARGRVGKYLMDIKWFRFVCRSCHRIIEENPNLAKEKGLSYSRLKKD